MKKILIILMAMFVFGLQNVNAQDAPLKIVTNHPDFNIKVKRCAASGKTVIIDLIFTNEGANDVSGVSVNGGNGRNYTQWGPSEAYDDEGNIYRNISVRVANYQNYTFDETPTIKIPVGVPMKCSVKIEGVDVSAQAIARMELFVNCKEWAIGHLGSDATAKPVKFSNIPITRK